MSNTNGGFLNMKDKEKRIKTFIDGTTKCPVCNSNMACFRYKKNAVSNVSRKTDWERWKKVTTWTERTYAESHGYMCLGYALLLKANQLLLGVILGLLYLGCVVFDCLFLSKGKHSYGITACGYGIAAALIPVILQCINLQSDSYIAMAALGVPTIIANAWAMNGCKKLTQEYDESIKVCLALKGRRSRILFMVLYVLGGVGIVLALVAVIGGTLPVNP